MARIPRPYDSPDPALVPARSIAQINEGVAGRIGAAGRAMGNAIEAIGSAFADVANRMSATEDATNAARAKLEFYRFDNETWQSLSDSVSEKGDGWEKTGELYQRGVADILERYPVSNPKRRTDLQLFLERQVMERGFRAAHAKQSMAAQYYRGIEDQEINGAIARIEANPSQETVDALKGPLFEMIEGGRGHYSSNADIEARKRQIEGALMLGQYRGLLKKDPDAAHQLWQKILKGDYEIASPGSSAAVNGDISIFTSGKRSKRPDGAGIRGWTASDPRWNSLNQFEKAAVMALMEADDGRMEDAKNALAAMINRAAKNEEDLGIHVSRAIYQPTFEKNQHARLNSILRSPKFHELVQWGLQRAAGEVPDPVNGATHFLAHESAMLAREAENPNKYRSWRGWSGYDKNTKQYRNVIHRDRSHAFVAPDGALSWSGPPSIQQPTPNQQIPEAASFLGDIAPKILETAKAEPGTPISELLSADQMARIEKIANDNPEIAESINFDQLTVGDVARLVSQPSNTEDIAIPPGRLKAGQVFSVKSKFGEIKVPAEAVNALDRNMIKRLAQEAKEIAKIKQREQEVIAEDMARKEVLTWEKSGKSHTEFDRSILEQTWRKTPKKLAEFDRRMAIAKSMYEMFSDAANLPTDVLEDRFDRMRNSVIDSYGDADPAGQSAVDRAEKRLNAIKALRERDPARAVLDTTEVKSVISQPGFDKNNKASAYALVDATIKAQLRLGLPQVPVTKEQARLIMSPIIMAPEREKSRVANEVAKRLIETYGNYAEMVLAASAKMAHGDTRDDNDFLTSAMRRARRGTGSSTRDVDRVIQGAPKGDRETPRPNFFDPYE